jgi:hypothetical protein
MPGAFRRGTQNAIEAFTPSRFLGFQKAAGEYDGGRRGRGYVANFEVIAAVSDTLKVTLKEALTASIPTAEVEFLDVDKPPAKETLTIFLFEVGEDPSARNHARVRETEPPNLQIRKPPMALLLRYLMTSWGGDHLTMQKILGRTMQVLYDKPVLSGLDLQGVLKNTDETLKVTLSPLSLEERTRVWHAVQKPYHLSVSYEVRVVNLDSAEGVNVAPVTRRTADFAGLENA